MSKEARSEKSNRGRRRRDEGSGHSWQKEQPQQAFHTALGNPCGTSICLCLQEQPTPIRSFVVTVKRKEVEVFLKSAFKDLRKFQLCFRRQMQRGSSKSALWTRIPRKMGHSQLQGSTVLWEDGAPCMQRAMHGRTVQRYLPDFDKRTIPSFSDLPFNESVPPEHPQLPPALIRGIPQVEATPRRKKWSLPGCSMLHKWQ